MGWNQLWKRRRRSSSKRSPVGGTRSYKFCDDGDRGESDCDLRRSDGLHKMFPKNFPTFLSHLPGQKDGERVGGLLRLLSLLLIGPLRYGERKTLLSGS